MSSDNTCTSFEDLGLIPEVLNSLQQLGYESPTSIQAKAIPVLLEGRNLLGQAQTGTGKTGAFALPLLCSIDVETRVPQVLVLTPTRELAIQVSESFKSYAQGMRGFRVLAVYGGQSMSQQLQALKKGVHVVVGTPGRIMDHLRRKSLRLDSMQSIVLDEADEMLKMGFIEDIEWILDHTPDEKQVALFSATMPKPVRRVAEKYLKNEVEIKIESKTSTVTGTEQCYWFVRGVHKLDALTRMLEVEETDATMIFVRTKSATVELADQLKARGYSCAAINGDLNQALRESTIQKLKNGQLDVVVATDVAARGLDVDRISHVINYDIPFDPEAYVHRIGRTGRAGRTGKAILFVSPRETRMLRTIERATRQPIKEFNLPDKEVITKIRIERFKEKVHRAVEKEKLEFFSEIINELVSDHGTSLHDIAAGLCLLAQEGDPLLVREKPVKEKAAAPKRGAMRERRADRKDSRRRRSSREEPRRRSKAHETEPGMVSCRIEVGRRHGVNPGSIVAAIAEKGGIQGKVIGRINLHNDYSTVDLPEELPKAVFRNLKRAWVANRPMNLTAL